MTVKWEPVSHSPLSPIIIGQGKTLKIPALHQRTIVLQADNVVK
jgi:hypothetical protein